MAAIFGQSANSSHSVVCASGIGCLKSLEGTSIVFGIGHHRVVGSLLHDSPIGGLLWKSSAFVVAGVGAWQCHSRIQGVSGTFAPSPMGVTPP